MQMQIWDTGEPAARVGAADTTDEALELLDAECRRRYGQAAANGEGAIGMRHRFEIRDESGKPVVWLIYSPDVSRPYESVIDQDQIEVRP